MLRSTVAIALLLLRLLLPLSVLLRWVHRVSISAALEVLASLAALRHLPRNEARPCVEWVVFALTMEDKTR
jgi:hypothetical protein